MSVLPTSLRADQTSVSVWIHISNQSDGTHNDARDATGLTASSFSTAKYCKTGGSDTTITLSDLSTITSAYSSGGIKELADGWYRLDIPDAAIPASGQKTWAVIHLSGTSASQRFSGHLLIDTQGVNVTGVNSSTLSSSQTGTLPADNVAWKGATLATVDSSGYPKVTVKSGTGTGEISLSAGLVALQNGTITSSTFAANAITSTVVADNFIGPTKLDVLTGLRPMAWGLCQSGSFSSTTAKMPTNAPATANYLTGCAVLPVAGTGANQAPAAIIGYTSGQVATFAAAVATTYDATTQVVVKPAVYGSNTIIFV